MAPQADFGLEGKAAIVTGAGRGLGQAVALALAGAGADLVLVARSRDQLEETAAEIRALGRRAVSVAGDVTAEGAPAEAVRAAQEQFGRLDILVLAAGVAITKPALEITSEDWDRVLEVNLKAAFFWSQVAGRHMIEAGSGRIIYMASIVGQVGMAQIAPYCASKGGLMALTRALAVEWARQGVTVNAIAPGYVKTAMNADVMEDPRSLAHITAYTPMRRLGQSNEIAGAAVYLASEAASFVTGHVLVVDGGWLAS